MMAPRWSLGPALSSAARRPGQYAPGTSKGLINRPFFWHPPLDLSQSIGIFPTNPRLFGSWHEACMTPGHAVFAYAIGYEINWALFRDGEGQFLDGKRGMKLI